MQSKEFLRSFDNAAMAIVEQRNDPQVKPVLDHIRQLALNRISNDPLVDRNLFIDPYKTAQFIQSKRKVVQTVIDDLRNFRLVHVWKKVYCPNNKSTIAEVRTRRDLKKVLYGQCISCGRNHKGLGKEFLETTYAINVDITEKRMGVVSYLIASPNPTNNDGQGNPSSFGGDSPPPPTTATIGLVEMFRGVFLAPFFGRGNSAVNEAVSELNKNYPAKRIPSVYEVIAQVAQNSLYVIVVWMIFSVITIHFKLYIIWGVITFTLLIAGYIVAHLLIAKIRNLFVIPKNLMFFTSKICMVLAFGAVAPFDYLIHWAANVNNPNQRISIEGSVSSGSVNWPIMYALYFFGAIGVIATVITYCYELNCKNKVDLAKIESEASTA